jgi:hypothetical protein
MVIDTARENDAKRAREVCAGIHSGEIVIFDRAYVAFAHLFELLGRGVFWVTRSAFWHLVCSQRPFPRLS